MIKLIFKKYLEYLANWWLIHVINYMFGDKKIKIKDSERSLISETVSIEGTINSSGAIDVAGLIKGPVYSKELIVRDTGSITGTIEADNVEIHGHLDGKVSA